MLDGLRVSRNDSLDSDFNFPVSTVVDVDGGGKCIAKIDGLTVTLDNGFTKKVLGVSKSCLLCLL